MGFCLVDHGTSVTQDSPGIRALVTDWTLALWRSLPIDLDIVAHIWCLAVGILSCLFLQLEERVTQ